MSDPVPYTAVKTSGVSTVSGLGSSGTGNVVVLSAAQMLTVMEAAIADAPESEPVAIGKLWIDAGVLKVSPGIPPAITVQPADDSVAEELPVTFSVTATNATSYQWYRDGVLISGATSSSYTFTTVIADNGIEYTCVVTGLGGSVTSDPATLTVTSLPAVTSATLVFDFNPAAAGFSDGQAVSSLAAANNGSITATQGTGSSQPAYRAAAGRRLKPCLDFDGGDLLNVTAPTFKHLFLVAEGDYPDEKPNAYASMYVAGNGGDFHQYCMVHSNTGSGPNSQFQTPTGTVTRKQNGDLVSGGSYWNSWIRPSQINIYDISKTIDWPVATAHTLGGMTGNPARGWDGRIFRVLAYTAALDTDDRASIITYLRAKYQTPQIIFSGDSLTNATGATSQAYSYANVARAAITGSYSYWVSGFDGYYIETLTSNVNPTAIYSQQPHTVVVWAGTNNFVLGNQSAATAKGHLNSNVAALKSNIPGVRVIVCTLPPDDQAGAGNAANYRSQAPLFSAAIVADADYTNGVKADGIVRLDSISQLQDASNATYFSDGLHMTDAGYALVGAAVAAKINELDA